MFRTPAEGAGGGVYHATKPSPGPLVGRPEALRRWPSLREHWDAVARRFPVRIPRGWSEHPALLRTALPDAAELLDDEGDVADPVGDAARSPLPWVVRKHDDRVLLLLTKRCHLYCRYCFRRDHHPGGGEDPTPEEWDRMLAYAKGAREVILSGGDPLAIRDERLFEAIDRVRPSLVRIHTRAPITWPRRVTPALVEGLRARTPLWILVHANHPAELSAPVQEALGRLVDAGLPVLNQSVLLAGINDDVDVLAELSERLLALRVFPYYLHHPDPAAGTAHFRVDPHRGVALHRALRARTSGLGLPSYVLDRPDGSGKIPVEEYLAGSGTVG